MVKIELFNNCSRNNYSFTSLSNSFLFRTTKGIQKNAYGQGYDVKEIKDSREATEQEEEEAIEEAEEDEDD
jgi:hypothetical protein